MTLQGTLDAGRRAHLSRMVDTFDIGTPSREYDPVTGAEVETVTPLFSTRGYFAAGARAVRGGEVAGRPLFEAAGELRIPWDSPLVPATAVAVCTAVGVGTPPRMLGRRVRVDGSGGDGSQRTHYPLQVTEVLS